MTVATLFDLIDNNLTDKNTMHSYLETYQSLFESKKETAKNVLEIGIYRGGSIKLWQNYFQNATVYGADWDEKHIPDFVKDLSRVNVLFGDAYSESFITDKISDTKFDIIVEDGAHTYDGVTFVAKHYSKLLAEGGILVIEDVQDMSWIDAMKNELPDDLKNKVSVLDNRHVKGRYDDVLFIVQK